MWESRRVGAGTRIQSGIPKRPLHRDGIKARGLLLRGVVTATYVTDNDGHPQAGDSFGIPSAVYCDVLVYASISGQRWFTLGKVLVSQSRGGIHRGDIWKPRATTQNLLGDLNEREGSNVGYFDGDHVLIGFLNDSLDQPIIIRGLPHPSRDVGNDNYELGKRVKLKAVDGDPEFHKHHGVYWGVDDQGNHVVDTTFGNDGSIDAGGKEPDPPTNGTQGNQIRKIPVDSSHELIVLDMADPLAPVEVGKLIFRANGSQDDVTLQLGTGAVSVAIADHLEALYTTALTGIKAKFETHKHPTGTGPSGVPDVQLPGWDSEINSVKLTISDN